MNKILIVSKSLESRGGVAAFFRLFRVYFQDREFELEFFAVGSRPEDYERRARRRGAYLLELWQDLAHFRRRLKCDPEIQVVQVNPSLIPVALFRDALFLLTARCYRKKTVVFFHGWRDETVTFFNRHKLLLRVFRYVFLNADACFVLARRFGRTLTQWGLPREKLHCTTTAYDDQLLQKRSAVAPNCPLRLLFLGRISRAKGVDVLLEALLRFAAGGGDFTMDFYGHAADSGFLAEMKKRAQAEPRIRFHDYVDGEEKYHVFSNADVFLLPSCAEGCPTALLEAAGTGCFLLSTPVGAVPELLENSPVGRLFPIGDGDALLREIRRCAEDLPELRMRHEKIAGYAGSRWTMRMVVRQFLETYRLILEEK